MSDTLTLELPARLYAWTQLVHPDALLDWSHLEHLLAVAARELTRYAQAEGRDPLQPGAQVTAHDPLMLAEPYTHHLPKTRLRRLLGLRARTEQRTSRRVLLRYTLHLPAVRSVVGYGLELWETDHARVEARRIVQDGMAYAGVMPTAYMAGTGRLSRLAELAEQGALDRCLHALGYDPDATRSTERLWPFL